MPDDETLLIWLKLPTSQLSDRSKLSNPDVGGFPASWVSQRQPLKITYCYHADSRTGYHSIQAIQICLNEYGVPRYSYWPSTTTTDPRSSANRYKWRTLWSHSDSPEIRNVTQNWGKWLPRYIWSTLESKWRDLNPRAVWWLSCYNPIPYRIT